LNSAVSFMSRQDRTILLLPRMGLLILLVSLLTPGLFFGQTREIDSLRNRIWSRQLESELRLNALLSLSDLKESIHQDSLFGYIALANQLIGNKTDPSTEARILLLKANVLTRRCQFDSASYLLSRIREDPRLADDPKLPISVNYQLTELLFKQRKKNEALKLATSNLQLAENLNSTEWMVKTRMNLGRIYFHLDEHENALRTLREAALLAQKQRMPEPQSNIAWLLARVFKNLRKTDSACIYLQQALLLSKYPEDLALEANVYHTYSELSADSGNTVTAEQFLLKSQAIREKIADPHMRIAGLYNLGLFYHNSRQYSKSITTLQSAISLAQQRGLRQPTEELYQLLAKNYLQEKRLEDYARTMNRLIAWKDSIEILHDLETTSALETRHQLQLREKNILEQKLQLARKTQILSLLLITLGIAIPLGIFISWNSRKRKKQEGEIRRLEEEARMQKAISEAREEERKRIAADLHDQLGSYAAAISINASVIGRMVKSEEEKNAVTELNKNAGAIVSQLNDTIWVLTRGMLSVTAVADRIKVYVLNLQKSYRQIDFHFHEELHSDPLIAPIPALHLLKILQEGINNAVRHSQAHVVNVHFKSSDSHWDICVADNGIGMPITRDDSGKGNGMANMKKRASEAHFQIRWESNPGGGTRLLVSGAFTGSGSMAM
jgi:signal transduction histidine kinase